MNKFLLLYLGAALMITGVTWRWYFNNPPVKSSDCTTIVGTLRSFAEEGSTKSPLLNFSIEESPANFCVPMDGYRESFDSYAFLRNAHAGEKLWITVDTHQIWGEPPALSNPSAVIFAIALRDNKLVYSTVSDRTKWETHNRKLGLDSAIAFTALTALYISGLIVWHVHLFKLAHRT